MQSLNKTLQELMRGQNIANNIQQTMKQVYADKDVQAFLNENRDRLSKEAIKRGQSKLYEFFHEKQLIEKGVPTVAPGYCKSGADKVKVFLSSEILAAALVLPISVISVEKISTLNSPLVDAVPLIFNVSENNAYPTVITKRKEIIPKIKKPLFFFIIFYLPSYTIINITEKGRHFNKKVHLMHFYFSASSNILVINIP